MASLVIADTMLAFDCTNYESKKFNFIVLFKIKISAYCVEKDAMLYPSFQIYENGKFLKTFEPKTIEDFVSALSGTPPT